MLGSRGDGTGVPSAPNPDVRDLEGFAGDRLRHDRRPTRPPRMVRRTSEHRHLQAARTGRARGPATVGTSFTSSGAADNGTFHDRSVVTEASRPTRFTIETDARLERKRGELWEAHFSHRYDIEPDDAGSKIVYTETVERANYTPYWLNSLVRPIFRPLVNRADRKQLENLARLAEERSVG